MEEDDNESNHPIPHGHITSLAVLRTHRKCGIATNLMKQAHARMVECFHASFCSLHVRYTNVAAFHLYSQTLGYKISGIEKGYYADGEDAYAMKCEFKKSNDKLVDNIKKLSISTTTPPVNISTNNNSSSSTNTTSNHVDNSETKDNNESEKHTNKTSNKKNKKKKK
eukprot:gene20936-27137_t